MKLLKLFCILSIIVTMIAAQNTNYCNTALCPTGKKHIACGNNGAFASSCPANALIINMQPHITTIVTSHNLNRNLIAGGGLPGYKQATRMATMQWDTNLAALATFNVRQCVMKHDSCRNTPQFKKSGQNLYLKMYSGEMNRNKNGVLIKNAIDAWWIEYKNANMNYINTYPNNYSGPKIGHFTVFANDRNIRVGCGAARFRKNNMNNFLIACNYAATNIIGQPVYTAGNTASKCTTGRNPTYKSLCSTSETYG